MRWTAGAVVGTMVLLAGCGETATGGDGPGAEAAPQGWRTEYWHDTSVQVPADWAYGGAPMRGPGGRYSCHASAMVSAEGDDLPGGSGAYVGRPVMLTDVCMAYPVNGPGAGPPEAPYVWLGAAVEPGREDLGEGWVQETVEVDGSTVTVATDDPALRERILASVTGGETCFSEVEVDRRLPGEVIGGDPSEASSLRVCAYRRDDHSSPLAHLTYAAELGEAATEDYVAALREATAPRDQCPSVDHVEGEWVVLELLGGDGATIARHVVHFVCPGIDRAGERLTGFETVGLTEDRVRPWAVGGVSAVISGPGDPAWAPYFIGPQG